MQGPRGRLDSRQQTALFVTLLFPRRQLTGVGGRGSRHEERRGVGTPLGTAAAKGTAPSSSCIRPSDLRGGADVLPEAPHPEPPFSLGPSGAERQARGWPASCWLPRALAWPGFVCARRQVPCRGWGLGVQGL